MPFSFSAGYVLSVFARCSKHCGAFPVLLSIIHFRMAINHRTAFPGQRVYTSTDSCAHMHSPGRASVPPSVSRLDRGRCAMSDSGFIQNLHQRTAIGNSMALSSCRNSITASHTQLFFLMEVMIMAETDAPTGWSSPLTNGFQQIFLFLFAGLTKRVFAEPSAGAYPMPMSFFCIVKIKCLTL